VRVRILGSAAGGGFPQWNCACTNCHGLRNGAIKAAARTQDSICLSSDGEHWVLVNASPDVRSHIESYPPLHPRHRRDSPIHAIFLTNGDLDHCLGLLSLRENHPLALYATDVVRHGFTADNVLYRTLQRFPGQIAWNALKLGIEEMIPLGDGRPSGLSVAAVALPGKPPVHLEGLAADHPEMNIGLRFHDHRTGRVLAYGPGIARFTAAVGKFLRAADCVLLDGTFWSNDELSALGISGKSAEDLAHWPIGGGSGSLSVLSTMAPARRIFVHLNNTNPILREDSPERRAVEAAGWEVAHDGMELRL
jgi:pyrroloquinoline quinone biosynthesis protein B